MQPFSITDHLFSSLIIEPDGNGVVYVAIATDTEEAGRQVALDAEAIQTLIDRLEPAGSRAIRDRERQQRSAERARKRQQETPHRPLRSQPQPAVSAEVRKDLTDRSKLGCEIGLPGCTGLACDPHHRHNRGMGGRHRAGKARYERLSMLIHACRSCHRQVTSPSGEARAEYLRRGLILQRGDDPLKVPVILGDGRMVWLTDDGDRLEEPPETAVA